MIKKYLNKHSNSPISYYELAENFIAIYFYKNQRNKNGCCVGYVYTLESLGSHVHLQNMRLLAINGKGLATYIQKNLRRKGVCFYASKKDVLF